MTTALRQVAAFDVDSTLTTRDTLVPFLLRLGAVPLVTSVVRRPVELGRAAARRDRETFKEVASAAVFAGRPLSEVREQAEAHADRVVESRMRSSSHGHLQDHLERGDVVVLVSANYEVFLEPFGERLGVDHALGTRLEVDGDGVLTGRLGGANCRGPEKVRRLHALLADRYDGRDAVRIVAYGDSSGDRELLADADEAHWVKGRR